MTKPTILTEGNYTASDVEELKSNAWRFQDIFVSQLGELFEINNASLIKEPDFKSRQAAFIEEQSGSEPALKGNYVFYPWSGLLLHLLGKDELRILRTNRTNNLITPDEQARLSQFTAGVAGLSFGNGIALSQVYTGISDTIKLADTDIFETTNLNRVRVGLPSVTQAKTDVTAQDIYEINPYANVEIFDAGLTEDNLADFIGGTTKLNIVFDVVDDFAMKVRLRLAAREAHIPVIMLTSLEDSVLVDVERFDLDPNAEPFHGLLGSVTNDLLTKTMSEQDKARYAMAIVGPERISYRNLMSLANVGRSLVSRPHLYGTVSIVCGLASYIAKRIALGEDMPSMRKHLKFNEMLDIADNKDDTPEARQELLSRMMEERTEDSH